MADENRPWIRNILLVPLVIGLVVTVFAYVLPKFFEPSRELSYQVEEPVAYLEKASLGSSVVKVNDVPVAEVYAARVRIWNSGSLPLKDVAVRFELASTTSEFKILSTSHNTKPSREFGSIVEQGSEQNAKRFVFALLNPSDEDAIVFLTSHKADVKVFSKAEGLSLKAMPYDKPKELKWYYVVLGTMLASLATSLLEVLFKAWRLEKKELEGRGKP
jgi:hypothetical protein